MKQHYNNISESMGRFDLSQSMYDIRNTPGLKTQYSQSLTGHSDNRKKDEEFLTKLLMNRKPWARTSYSSLKIMLMFFFFPIYLFFSWGPKKIKLQWLKLKEYYQDRKRALTAKILLVLSPLMRAYKKICDKIETFKAKTTERLKTYSAWVEQNFAKLKKTINSWIEKQKTRCLKVILPFKAFLQRCYLSLQSYLNERRDALSRTIGLIYKQTKGQASLQKNKLRSSVMNFQKRVTDYCSMKSQNFAAWVRAFRLYLKYLLDESIHEIQSRFFPET